MIVCQWGRPLAATVATVMLTVSHSVACDDLTSKLVASYLDPVIRSLGCGELGKHGLDVPSQKLNSVCYKSSGSSSSIEMVVSLNCHTGPHALIPSSISERVTADVDFELGSCSVQNVQLRPSGEIGKVIFGAFDIDGHARVALQKALNKLCGR